METRMHRSPCCFVAILLAAVSCAAPGARGIPAPQVDAPGQKPVPTHPSGTLLAAFGGGKFDFETQGSSLEGDSTATMVRLMGEGNSKAGFGAGLNFEAMQTGDDLLEDLGGEPTEGTSVDFFPYFLYQVRGSEQFRMPLRLGLWLRTLEVEGQLSGDAIRWTTLGLRFSAEPEVVLARSPGFGATVFADLSLATGSTDIDSDIGAVGPLNGEYDTDAGLFAFEIGPRFRFDKFFFGVSFLHRAVSYGDSDPVGGIFIRGVDETVSCFMVTFGARL